MNFTSVWKYLSPSTAKLVLETKTLRFSPLNEVDTEKGVIPVLNDRTDCAFDLADEVARVMQAYAMRGVTFADRNPNLRDPDDTPEKTIRKSIHQQLRRKGLRILSLSHTSPLTPGANPLWGYYGDSAQGICLEFDQEALLAALDLDLKQGEKKGYSTPHLANKITYDDVAPKYPEPSLTPEAVAARMIQAAFRKDSAWDHENEFRVVICLDPDATNKSILTLPKYTWPFPKAVLVKIHLGEYCSKETIDLVYKLANGIPIRKDI
jgi:hypothetical protein